MIFRLLTVLVAAVCAVGFVPKQQAWSPCVDHVLTYDASTLVGLIRLVDDRHSVTALRGGVETVANAFSCRTATLCGPIIVVQTVRMAAGSTRYLFKCWRRAADMIFRLLTVLVAAVWAVGFVPEQQTWSPCVDHVLTYNASTPVGRIWLVDDRHSVAALRGGVEIVANAFSRRMATLCGPVIVVQTLRMAAGGTRYLFICWYRCSRGRCSRCNRGRCSRCG